MNKYTVLLADDEEEVIQIIIKKIDWDGLGFSVIGYANNGVKALEMIEEFQPDVVMTDIRMPYMDGIELAGHIKADFPATRVLFFTGFDEFEYAKEAVHLEVEEYVLKPVNSTELSGVFSQLKVKLDKEISEKRNVEVLQKYYMESLPLLQAEFYASLIEGRIEECELQKYLEDYQLSLPGPFFCCLVIHTSSEQVPENINPVLVSASIQKQANERLAEKWDAKCFSYLGNTILMAQLKSESEVPELTDECDRFCKYALRIIGAVVTIGIGKVCNKLAGMQQSYKSAREAVSYRAIYGTSRSINMKEIIPQKTAHPVISNDAVLSNLFKAIRVGSEEDVAKAARQYMCQIIFPKNSLQQHHIYIMELISTLYNFSVNIDIGMEDFPGNINELYTSLLDTGPDALREWLERTSLSLREKLITARNKSTKSFVNQAVEYVHNNYADEELSLDSVCSELGVSNSYFSTIFKKETGKPFISYLTDYRMDKAVEMLVGTNEKSYIIAKNTGYTDPNYFSYVFKRRFGVSPSKYRTEHTGNDK